MGRAGRAEKVRAPIGGCNIVLGRERRKACGQGCYVVLSSGGGVREGREGREEREEREGREGQEGREERKGCGHLLEAVILY